MTPVGKLQPAKPNRTQQIYLGLTQLPSSFLKAPITPVSKLKPAKPKTTQQIYLGVKFSQVAIAHNCPTLS
jgi:hypothetical protein